MKKFIRVYKEMDISKMIEQLIIAGELQANCANCNQIGIDFITEKRCPQCGTEFKYIAFRSKRDKAEEFSQIRRLLEKRQDLMVIDHTDFVKASGKIKAYNIFEK
ncbi:MAG: hypothetical protein ABH952_06475 [Candidatus Omnitrophota bacterium]